MRHSQTYCKVMLCMFAGSVMGPLACGSTIDAAEGEFNDEASADGSGGDMDTGPEPPKGPLEPGECITDYIGEETVGINTSAADHTSSNSPWTTTTTRPSITSA